MDEAGRGALAGPLAIGFVIFSKEFLQKSLPHSLTGVNDSKLLSVSQREELVGPIIKHADYSAVIFISNRMIDTIGINGATEFAIIRACHRAHLDKKQPELLLIDGNYKFPNLTIQFPQIKYKSIIKGDSRVFSIAAASILAKVYRDARMIKFSYIFPEYELKKHKGYGTKRHRKLVQLNGISNLHRKTYLKKIYRMSSPSGS